MTSSTLRTLGIAALCACTLAAQSREPRNVPISGAIDQPGIYLLTRDLQSRSTGAPAITITASDVVLDLNGQAIRGAGGKSGTGVRIQSASGVTVRNGIISNMAFGVIVNSSRNVTLTGLQIRGEGLPVVSAPPETGIMIAQSRNVVVEHNSIYNTGLGIFVRGGQSWGNRIANNTITAGANGVFGICYNPADSDPLGPRGDLIYANHVTNFATGLQASAMSQWNVFKENVIFYTTGMAVELLNDTNMDMNNIKVALR